MQTSKLSDFLLECQKDHVFEFYDGGQFTANTVVELVDINIKENRWL